MELKTSEFFKNIKKLPPKDSVAWHDLKDWELDKCLGGVSVNGIHISGFMYWHLNHWYIALKSKDNYGNIIDIAERPTLRDNEWEINDGLNRARAEGKGLMIAGSRRIGKTELESSWNQYHCMMFENSQNVIMGGDDDDLSLIKARIDFGNPLVWEGIRIPKLDNDWKKPMVRMGFKTKDGIDKIYSYIVIRNAVKGQKKEGVAGTTSRSFIADEVAKYSFAQPFSAAVPSFLTSQGGWGAIPLLTCTGGDMTTFQDAQRYFWNPDANNLVSYKDPETAEVTGLFLSGCYRPDCKVDSTLEQYLKDKGVLDRGKEYKELAKLPMKVTDKEKALRVIQEERRQKSLDPDQTEYRKQIMYFPLTAKECFMSSSNNFYSMEIIEKQLDKLSDQFPGGKIGMYVDLYEEDGSVKHRPSKKVPISSFPTKTTEDLDACVVILEHPDLGAPHSTYTAGVDPYKFSETKHSDSLGSVYIFKRCFDPLSESFQDMVVAYYNAKPPNKTDWNRTSKLLIKYYNAITLCENDEYSFCDYMISEGEGHYLHDTPDWIKEYNPKSSSNNRGKGVSANPKNIQLFRTTLKQYLEEPFAYISEEGKTVTTPVLGVSKLNDPMALTELKLWNPDGNFDRERALSLAILMAKKLDAEGLRLQIGGTSSKDPRFTYNKNNVDPPRSPFAPSISSRGVTTKANRLFPS